MSIQKKQKFDFNNLIANNDFEVNEGDSAVKPQSSNILTPNVDTNDGSLKKAKKNKEYEYKKIFDNSLDSFKNIKNTAHIYEHNMKKIALLKSMNPNVNITEIINYIVNDFFVVNSDEIKEEYKIISSEFNKNL